jgi:hypothetical protein
MKFNIIKLFKENNSECPSNLTYTENYKNQDQDLIISSNYAIHDITLIFLYEQALECASIILRLAYYNKSKEVVCIKKIVI